VPNTTTNFSFNKPIVNSATDEDLWGGQLNDNWDQVDAFLPLPAASKFGAVVVQSTDDTNFEIVSGQGTSGQVLTSNGADALPSFQAGAAWVLLSTQEASTSANINFDNTLITSTHKNYKVIISSMDISADNAGFNLQMSVDNGSAFLTVANHTQLSTDASTAYNATLAAGILHNKLGNGTGENFAAELMFHDPSNTASFKLVTGIVAAYDATPRASGGVTFHVGPSASAVNYIRFLPDAGTILTGTFKLYGIL